MNLSEKEINKRIAEICGIPLKVKRWKYTYFNGAITSSGHVSKEAAIADSNHLRADFLQIPSPNAGLSDPIEYEADNDKFLNYCGDLNAIQTAVLSLKEMDGDLHKGDKFYRYLECLAATHVHYPVADALTRAKAFISIFEK